MTRLLVAAKENVHPEIPHWVKLLMVYAREQAPKGFYGTIELNFKDGTLINANVTNSYK